MDEQDTRDTADRKPSRRARRRLDDIAIRDAEAGLKLKLLALDEAVDAAVDRQVAKDDATETKTRAARALDWVKEKRIFLGSAAVAFACAAIAVIGQVDFYKTIDKLPKVIAYLFPIGVESISWVFGAAAAYCVAKNLPSGKYINRMWGFAAFAAAVNTYHGVTRLGDVSVGVVLGLASLFGPFVWHSYTGMTRVALSGRSMEEIKVAAKTRLLHPWISWRADRVQTLLQCSRGEAWVYALSYSHKELRAKVAAEMQKKLEKASLTVMTVDGAAVEIVKPAPKVKAPAAKSAVEQKPTAEVAVKTPEPKSAPSAEIELKPAPPVNLTLVRQYGEKRAEAIARWEARLNENDGNGPSLRSIDIEMSGSYTGTAKGAIALFIKDHGDPREKRQQNRKDGMG